MMNLYENELYMEDVRYVAEAGLPWEKMQDSSILLSGATGLLGSFLIDTIMQKNTEGLNCSVYALGRSVSKFNERFSKWTGNRRLVFLSANVNDTIILNQPQKLNYVLHLASNTHPLQYATDPIGTITTNIIGLMNMLDLAVEHQADRFAFASSNEIYGENRGDTELFNEKYVGYIDSNTLRAGYPESKRCGEALCQAYRAQKGLNVVIPRFTRSYGPTMKLDDTKAISQFIRKAIKGEDIVLKSEGKQNYSYTYMADAVLGLFIILLNGIDGETYNIADEASNITLKELSQIIARHVGKRVVFDIPDSVEAAGYSRATKALLDGSKLKQLGWKPNYNIKNGIERTIDILRMNQ